MTTDDHISASKAECLTAIFAKARDLLTGTEENSRLARRGIAHQHLIKNKRVTAAALLEADFGTIRPNGLDIVSQPDAMVQIEDMETYYAAHPELAEHASFALLRFRGQYHGGDIISLNKRGNAPIVKPSLPDLVRRSGTLMHETIHRLQKEEEESGWVAATWNNNMMMVEDLPEATSLWKKGLNFLARRTRRASDDFKVASDHELLTSNYLVREDEVQARLHEILAIGYAGWQKLPTTRLEFWAALHNMGFRQPRDLVKALHTNAEAKVALKDFKCSGNLRAYAAARVAELNKVYDYAAAPENRDTMWRFILPAIYGNLLELYGDGPGRARMDMGINPHQHMHTLGKILQDLAKFDDKALNDLVDSVPVSLAGTLVARLIQGYPDAHPETARVGDVVKRLLAKQGPYEGDAGYDSGLPFLALSAGHRAALGAYVASSMDWLGLNTPHDGWAFRNNILNSLNYINMEMEKYSRSINKGGLTRIFTQEARPIEDFRIRNTQRGLAYLREIAPQQFHVPVTVMDKQGEPVQTTLHDLALGFERYCVSALKPEQKPSVLPAPEA